MELNPHNWSQKAKTSFAVLGPELTVAPAFALGAVYCATTLTPNLLKRIEDTVSQHIVQPHLAWFESRAGSLHLAHERHDQKKREELIKRGEPVEMAVSHKSSPKERADVIADVLVKGAIAMTADLASTRLSHHFLSGDLNLHLPKRIAFFETAAHLGGIAMMSGPFAVQGENAHYWLKHHLQKLGMSERGADDVGTALPYIIFPGQIAALGSLGLTLALNGKGAHR